MKRELKILGIISIALSAWNLYVTTDNFLNGPPIYDPSILYLFMLPRWHFFLAEWICFSALLLSGTFVFVNLKKSFYLYNFFMVSYIVSWATNVPGDFSLATILNGTLLVMCVVGLHQFRKPKTYKVFEIEKKLTITKYILIVVVFLILTELPVMIL